MSRSKVIQTGKNAIVEYLDLDTVTQLNGDMQAAKEIKIRHQPAATDLSVMGVGVGVQLHFS